MPNVCLNPFLSTIPLQTGRCLRGLLLAALSAIALPTHANPASKGTTDNDSAPIPEIDVEQTIDNAHKGASDLLNEFASQLDNYFGEEISTEEINDSRATVRLDFSDPGNDDFSTSAKFKLRLVLPRSQQRIRLLLDVDEDDNDGNSTVQTLAEDDIDRAFSFALRFMRNVSDKTRINLDLGARRFDQRFQTFTRFRLSTRFPNEHGWSFKINNDLRHYYSSGYTNNTRLEFWHKLNNEDSMFLRSSTSLNWEKIQNGARIDQTIGIYKELRQRSLLAFEVLAGYNTSPDIDAPYYEGHTARIRYRKNIFRPWLHYEIWPGISWFTEDNSKPKLGGLLRLEVQFGHYKR